MHHFIPHFSGNFSAASMLGREQFLVFETGNAESSVSACVESKKVVPHLISPETRKKHENLVTNVNLSLLKKERIERVMPGVSWEGFSAAMTDVNTRILQLQKNPKIKSFQGEISEKNKELGALKISGTPEQIEAKKAEISQMVQQYSLYFSHQQELIWREHFPDTTKYPSFKKAFSLMMTSPVEAEEQKKDLQQKRADVALMVQKTDEFPSQNAPLKNYINWRADAIIREVDSMGQLNGDPFKEVILFVKSGGKTHLSPRGLQVLKGIQNPKIEKKYHKSLGRKVRKISRDKQSKKHTTEMFETHIRKEQADVFLSEEMYQSGMIEIAKRANKLLSSEEKTAMGKMPSNGHMVKNKFVSRYKNGAGGPTLGAEKVNLENAFLYEVVGTWGMVTAFANILVALKSGNLDGWEAAMPYIALGAGTTYLTGKAVLDHSLDKFREPEKMPKWIMQEADHDDYDDFFGDEDEMTLWSNLQFSKTNTKSMKKSLKGVQDKKEDAIDKEKKPENSQMRFTDSGFGGTKNIDQSETLDPMEFAKGGSMEAYLPDIITTWSGKSVPKEEFLAQLNAKRGGVLKNNVRYKMFKKTLGRVGDNDDYLPYLHSLHEQAKASPPKKEEVKKRLKFLRKQCPSVGSQALHEMKK